MKAISRYSFNFERKYVVTLFKKLGYKKENNKLSWVKDNVTGRYHITFEGLNKYNIHYDVNIVGGRHMTLPSTHILQKEIKRIKTQAKKLNTNSFKKKVKVKEIDENFRCVKCYTLIQKHGMCKDCTKIRRFKKIKAEYANVDKDTFNKLKQENMKHNTKNWSETNIYSLKEKSINWEIGLIILVMGLIIINI